MTSVFMIVMVAIVGFAGVTVALTPLVMRRDEVFAVTVPSAHHDNPEFKRYRRLYLVSVLAATLICMIATALLSFASEAAFTIGIIAACLVPLIVSFVIFLRLRRKVQTIKEARGWQKIAEDLASADLSALPDKKLPSLWWSTLQLIPLILTLVIGFAFYARMPEQVPMQVNLSGQVARYAHKSYGLVFFVPAVQIFEGVIFTFVLWMIRKSRSTIDPLHPRSSMARFSQFARAQSIIILVFSIVLSAAFIFVQVSIVGFLSITAAASAFIVCLIPLLGVVLWSVVHYGQGGARLAHVAEDEAAIARDDDRYWRLGVFYYNPDDPAIFIPKRFGVGWTNNFARPLTWVLILSLIVLTAALIWFVLTFA